MRTDCRVSVIIPIIALSVVPGLAWGQEYREAFALPGAPLTVGFAVTEASGVLWRHRFAAPSSLYIRLTIRELVPPSDPTAEYTLNFRGSDERLRESHHASELRRVKRLDTIIFSDQVLVELAWIRGSPSGLHFIVDRPLAQRDVIGRVISESSLPSWKAPTNPAVKLLKMEPFFESVAKLLMGDGYTCSGFLVSPDSLLTNYHCLAHSSVFAKTGDEQLPLCSDIIVEFDFDGPRGRQARAACLNVPRSSPLDDYALLKLESVPRTSRGEGRRYLHLAARDVAESDSLVVLHHPLGFPLQVSFDCGMHLRKDRAEASELEHTCSTAGGSSGAPMLSRKGELLAMHHGGAYPRDMTPDEIDSAMARGEEFFNKALPARFLRERLRDLILGE